MYSIRLTRGMEVYTYKKETESVQQFFYLIVIPTEKIRRKYWTRGPPYTLKRFYVSRIRKKKG